MDGGNKRGKMERRDGGQEGKVVRVVGGGGDGGQWNLGAW
jgi:hypothetical protein